MLRLTSTPGTRPPATALVPRQRTGTQLAATERRGPPTGLGRNSLPGLESKNRGRPPLARARTDRGSALSVWVAVGMMAFILVLGIAVDATGQVSAQQEARSVAGEAARAGGQMVSGIAGTGPVQLDPVRAKAAAQRYLSAAGYDGTVEVTGSVVTVRINTTYKTLYLSIIGLTTLPVTAEEQSDSIKSFEGREP